MGVAISPREAEVLDALADRLTNAEIADRLYLSVRTVETYVSALLRKYDAENRRALSRIGLQRREERGPGPVARQLPSSLGSLIGRSDEVAAVTDGLAKFRLVTVVGPAGVGKTRLAVEAARTLRHDDHEVTFCDLTPASDEVGAVSALATAIGLPDAPVVPIRELLLRGLNRRPLLIVLDNCEHIIDEVTGLVDDCLAASDKLRILATSREPLTLPGELVIPLAPLRTPEADTVPGDGVETNDAVRLFAERAAATSTDFVLDEHTLPPVASICRRLDGMPLALELAAAQVAALTPQQIDARLRDRFQLLRVPARGRHDRHQALDAAVAWSYDLLEARERALLDRLAVFRGAFSLEAAETVAAGPPISTEQVIDLLVRLVRKSLVVAETAGDEKRFRLLETMREYGWQRLIDAGELDEWRSCHHAWAFERMRDVAAELSCSVVPEWLDALDEELENIEAALDWSMRTPEGAAEALTVVRSLERYWMARGVRRAHGVRWSTLAAERATTVECAARVEGLLGAVLLMMWSDLSAAGELARQAETLAATDIDATASGYAALAAGWVELFAGATGTADALLRRALALIDPTDPVHPWASAGWAILLGATGDWAGAVAALNDVAAECQRYDDAHMAGAWLSCAADFELITGDPTAARDHVTIALRQATTSDCASCESLALSVAAQLDDDPDTRLATARSALRLADGIGEVWAAIGVLELIVEALAAKGDAADAALLVGAARAIRASAKMVTDLPGRTAALERGDAAARAALDPATYAALVRDGERLDYASAVAHALA
jgi:non-specific serine/threonine protein kinase